MSAPPPEGSAALSDEVVEKEIQRLSGSLANPERFLNLEKEVKEHHPIVHSDGGKRELRKQTRYRDGKVASTTGERFLVEPKESAEFVKATSVSIRVTGGGRTH